MKKLKPADIDFLERFELKYRPTVLVHEIVARKAAMERNGSMQQVIDDAFLTPRHRAELNKLREKQRNMGYKDVEFYPAALLRRLGIKVPRGRPQRRFKKNTRA